MPHNPPQIGCYLDRALYTPDELSREIIALAVSFGMPPIPGAEPIEPAPEGESEFLFEASNDAIDWLNENTLADAPFCFWDNDDERGAFGLWPSVDGAKDDPSVLVEGPKDCQVEYVLEINDHGNATLYRLERVEVWSVV